MLRIFVGICIGILLGGVVWANLHTSYADEVASMEIHIQDGNMLTIYECCFLHQIRIGLS
jgi:hypothetical protein